MTIRFEDLPDPNPPKSELDMLAELCQRQTEAIRTLTAERDAANRAALRFRNEALAESQTRQAELNRLLDSVKVLRATTDRVIAERDTAVTALRNLLTAMIVRNPNEMTPERADELVRYQREARELLKLIDDIQAERDARKN